MFFGMTIFVLLIPWFYRGDGGLPVTDKPASPEEDHSGYLSAGKFLLDSYSLLDRLFPKQPCINARINPGTTITTTRAVSRIPAAISVGPMAFPHTRHRPAS